MLDFNKSVTPEVNSDNYTKFSSGSFFLGQYFLITEELLQKADENRLVRIVRESKTFIEFIKEGIIAKEISHIDLIRSFLYQVVDVVPKGD